MPLALLSASFESLPLIPSSKLSLCGADFPGGWVCVHYRTLWVSPTNSPVSLGVTPAAISTPTGVVSQRFEALFPCTETMGCAVCLAPQLLLLVYLHTNVGLPSPQSTNLPGPLGPPAAALLRVLSAWLPISASPPFLLVWMNVSFKLVGHWTSIQFDFLSVLVVFVFKFVVVVLLVVRGGIACLPTPPS